MCAISTSYEGMKTIHQLNECMLESGVREEYIDRGCENQILRTIPALYLEPTICHDSSMCILHSGKKHRGYRESDSIR